MFTIFFCEHTSLGLGGARSSLSLFRNSGYLFTFQFSQSEFGFFIAFKEIDPIQSSEVFVTFTRRPSLTTTSEHHPTFDILNVVHWNVCAFEWE